MRVLRYMEGEIRRPVGYDRQGVTSGAYINQPKLRSFYVAGIARAFRGYI